MPATAISKIHHVSFYNDYKRYEAMPENPTYNELKEKCRAQNSYIQKLETELSYKKSDITAAWSAAVMLIGVLGVVLYQWLVVCNGSAPV